MAQFINYNSFLITILILIGTFGFWYLRNSFSWQRFGRFVIIALIPIALYFNFRADSGDNESLVSIETQIGQGIPVLVELRSPN